MATPNIVPRADSEGGLGTASKYWASAYIDTIITTGSIGIGATPSDFHADADDLIVGAGSGNTGITIHSGTSGFGSIFFADGTADDATEKRGQIRYLQGTERMDFHTDGVATAALSLAASGAATFAGDVTVGGKIKAENASSTVHELIATDNNTRTTLSVKSKDSSGNSVDLRMHSLEGGRGEVYTFTNHALAFATNNAAPQMLLDTSGHLGIGNSTPQRKFEVLSTSSGSVIDAHIGGTYSTTNYQGLSFGYAESANTSYRHSALVFERDDNGVGDATGNVHILNSVSGSGSTSAVLADAKLSLLKTGSAILAGIPFYSGPEGNSMYTHDVSATDNEGQYNAAYGFLAMDAISTGDANVAIGYKAGSAIAEGSANVAVGYEALMTENEFGTNTAIGYRSLRLQDAGADAYNTAVGFDAGTSVLTGIRNTLIGGLSGDNIDTGSYNVTLGMQSLSGATGVSKNTAIGTGTLELFAGSGDTHNTAVGYTAGQLMITGVENTLIGSLAGDGITLGANNVALGYATLSAANAGSKSVAIGSGALAVQVPQFTDATCDTNHTSNTTTVTCDANSSIKVGMRVEGTGIDTGETVTITAVNASSVTSFTISHAAVSTNTNTTLTFTGGVDSYNTAVGYNAGNDVTTSVANTLIGGLAGDSITVGSSNTAFGFNAGGGTTTGGANTFIGSGAGLANEGGGNNICIGRDANTGGASFGNSITIGTSITNNIGSNSVEIGNTSMTKFKTHGAMTNRAYTGTAEGTGIDATDAVSISVGEYNSEIITNIFVDIGNQTGGTIISSSTNTGAIGNATDANAYITRVTTAVNGVVYKAELICLEVPTVSSGALMLDIDLTANASGTIASGSAVSGTPVCESSGSATLGRLIKSTAAITPDHYLYLAQSGTNAGVYNKGKFLIRLYGAKVTGL